MWTVSLYQDVKAACVATASPYNLRAVRCRVCSYGKPPGWSCPRLSLRPAQPPQESSFLPSRHLHLGSGHRHDDGHVQRYLQCYCRCASLQEFRAFRRISNSKSRKCWWMDRTRFFLDRSSFSLPAVSTFELDAESSLPTR